MRANKYGNLLTIILVILIIGILVGIGFLVYNYVIKPRSDENRTIEAIADFDKVVEENNNEQNKGESDQNLENLIAPPDNSSTSSGTTNKKIYYEGYVMIGYITIPKTNVKLPILDSYDPQAIEIAVATTYPSNPKLNEPGNVVIAGHNRKNGQLFSNNKKLSVGDKILIKDTTGRELTYTIYQKFQTTDTDTSFYTRSTNGIPEITLSTCTDANNNIRTIILARAE